MWRVHINDFKSLFHICRTRLDIMVRLLKYNSNWQLFVQNQWWKQKNVWDLFKINNKDTRTTSLMSFYCLSCHPGTDFSELALIFQLLIFNKKMPAAIIVKPFCTQKTNFKNWLIFMHPESNKKLLFFLMFSKGIAMEHWLKRG